MNLNRRDLLKLSAAACLAASVAFGQTLPAIPMRSGSNLRTGVYQDTILTPAAITQRGLKVLFQLPMEGDARGSESQPLIVPNVTMQDGRPRNLCIVSALNNLVWAYDAVTSDILWVQKLGTPVKSDKSIDFWGVQDHFGVLSTGVVDTQANIWYGVAWVAPDGVPAHGIHNIYGLNLKDGSFAFPPVQMPAPYDTVMRKQRSSLALATFGGAKTVFFASGTVLETSSTAAGYLSAFDIATKKVTLLPMAVAGGGAGIWMSGSGLVIDEAKQAIFGVTGNGTFNPAAGDWAETVFRASYTPPTSSAAGKFTIADWWTPYQDNWREANQANLTAERLAGHSLSTQAMPVNAKMNPAAMAPGINMSDEDLGSGPCSYIQQFAELLCAGKDSIGYLVSSQSMGKTQVGDLASPSGNYSKLLSAPFWYGTFPGYGVTAAPANAEQFNNNVWFDGMTNHVHMASVIDGTMVYVGAENSNVRAWQANPNHTLTYLANSDDVASPDLATTKPGGMTGWFCVGSTSGILACLRPHGDANKTVTAGDLFIFDDRNFATRADGSKQLKVLWRSDQHGITFEFNKFCPPIIWNGEVIVPTYNGNTGTLVLGLQ